MKTIRSQEPLKLSHAAQSTDPIPSKDDVNQLNKCLQWQLENHLKGLKFVKLDVDKLKIVVFTDSSLPPSEAREKACKGISYWSQLTVVRNPGIV